jgi:tRNA (pseudouridine54-N1)-methyltransferase
MRRIVLMVHRAPVSGAFSLNDLAGGGGRIDEVARAVSTGFLVSNRLRRDTEMVLLFSQSPPPAARAIRLFGERIRYLNPDERSTAALLKNALVRSIPLERDVEASPGLIVGPVDPLEELRRLAAVPGAFWLTESGNPEEPSELPSDTTVILGDADDPNQAERAVLEASGIAKLSLGPVPLRSSQCVDVWQNRLDRRQFSEGQLSAPL